ncbi:ABC-type Fe3+-hydroxamate transport system, periplasmic component [Corynebacterium mustelae]|uniref:ABC-type Fe3+-hydroxamate transport system, periplasmic component n=2 Tax=Corynebacterium mustelae TaxID=571915 RepID=A0A0G3GTC7_9CORY|nr:ABC-type Fe3+-hydroxamate transport system, periplasmic component [Corynebacterium mustelae]
MRPYSTTMFRAAAALAAALSLSLAGCADSGSPQPQSSAAKSAVNADFAPVTISHAFGETVIETKPERVATVAWGNHEVPLALGVVPVGMSKATWGDDDNNGVLPWVEEKLQELGAETPVLFDETDAIPFEEIEATEPDVILASYSGITEEDYKQLSKIAPTVAYPELPWTTSLDDMISMNAEALGLAPQATELSTDLDKQVADALAAHPKLADKNVLFTSFGSQGDFSKVGFYSTGDPRAGFLKDAGLGVPKIVEEKSKDADKFWIEVSAENPELFEDVDLLISYGSNDPAENEATLKKLQEDPLLGKIPAIANGHVAFLGEGPLASSANPSPLGIPWGVNKYFDTLEAAL